MRTRRNRYVIWLALAIAVVSLYPVVKLLRNPPNPIDQRLVKADNEFGFKLLKQLVKQDPTTNIVISPVGLALTLQLAYNGASGQSRDAMAKVMGLEGMSLQEINQSNGRLIRMLDDPNLGVRVDIGNSFSTGKGVRFKPEFLETNKRYYKAEISNLTTSTPDNRLAITGTSRFEGRWMYRLDKSEFDSLPFQYGDHHWNDVEAVSAFGMFSFKGSETGEPKIVRLLYANRRTSLYVLDSYSDVLSQGLDARSWCKWTSQMRQTAVMVCIPVFKVGYAADLGSSLKALGIDLSSDAAKTDFGKMCLQPFNVTGVQHSARVEVREGGGKPAPQQRSAYPQAFLANHPFFFAIRDDRTGLILFMGWVADPTQGLRPSH